MADRDEVEHAKFRDRMHDHVHEYQSGIFDTPEPITKPGPEMDLKKTKSPLGKNEPAGTIT